MWASVSRLAEFSNWWKTPSNLFSSSVSWLTGFEPGGISVNICGSAGFTWRYFSGSSSIILCSLASHMAGILFSKNALTQYHVFKYLQDTKTETKKAPYRFIDFRRRRLHFHQ